MNPSSEQHALKLAVYGNIFLSVTGLGFAFYTKSQAVLLDGVYSIISLILAIITLYISHLLKRPGNDKYPFGYAVFEPLINLAKGLIIGLVMLVSLLRAIETIIDGGNVVRVGGALVYGSTATIACLFIGLYMRRKAAAGGWPLVEVEVKNWFMDAAISAAVAGSFLLVTILKDTGLDPWLRYADSALVITMSVCFLSIPYGIIRENWAQLTGSSPSDEVAESIQNVVEELLANMPVEEHYLRIVQIGRMDYIQLYVIGLRDENADSIHRLDQIREIIYSRLRQKRPNITLDIVFTQNHIWAERAANVGALTAE